MFERYEDMSVVGECAISLRQKDDRVIDKFIKEIED